MRKLNEYTRTYINVNQIDTIFRSSDFVAYGVYKDDENRYYIDAYDGAYSIAELGGEFLDDSDAVMKAQKYIDEVDD